MNGVVLLFPSACDRSLIKTAGVAAGVGVGVGVGDGVGVGEGVTVGEGVGVGDAAANVWPVLGAFCVFASEVAFQVKSPYVLPVPCNCSEVPAAFVPL